MDELNLERTTRIEVIDHTRLLEDGGGRVYTYWNNYDKQDVKNPKIELSIQDNGQTLKIFITK